MIILGICGGSASGKTTLAKKVHHHFQNSTLLSQDDYFLSSDPEKIQSTNFDHPNAINWPLLHTHLEDLKNGKSIKSPKYDFATSSSVADQTEKTPNDILILEGILIFNDPVLIETFTHTAFLDVPLDLMYQRRKDRDQKERGTSLETTNILWNTYVVPMYHQYVYPSRLKSNVLFQNESLETMEKFMISWIQKSLSKKA